ncbi:MAG TPA: hypothetical protein DCX07_04715 [Phycisphaerales bacterium]|nr:hypothetical protein [Phycisphaerales bacterium]
MTAEIAIMNRGSIALAADSAVTLQRPGGAKIYNSVNKLFMLSKYRPVGVMVYGQAEFIGVPWETIIKEYRKRLGMESFPSLCDYVKHFLNFLAPDSGLFSQEERDRYFHRSVGTCFVGIKDRINKEVKKFIGDKGGITQGQVSNTCTAVVKATWTSYEKAETLPCFQTLSLKALVSKYQPVIEKIRKAVFENLPLSSSAEKLLSNIAISLFLKDRFVGPISGVVIAGFGESEHFPSLVSVLVDGFLDDQLRQKEDRNQTISAKNSAAIIPFAQSEMVHTFMEGIDPYYHRFLGGYLGGFFEKLPLEIADGLRALRSKAKGKLTERLKASCMKLLEELNKQSDTYRRDNHVTPIIEAVTFLPKDELAAMAESLVNLTSFKRRISMDAETVGGPIDVAVISKGDGFIWIKRKHYFEPKLNPAFFANYYMDRKPAEEGEQDAQGIKN